MVLEGSSSFVVAAGGGVVTRSASAAERWLFFRRWVRHPLQIASAVPSGRTLAAAMMTALPPGARRVVEVGAGTGVFTAALLASGIAPGDLLVVERDRHLHKGLAARFPRVTVVCADAVSLPSIVAIVASAADRNPHSPADAVVSGLGFRPMPPGVQELLLAAIFAVLAPGGVLVQFTYGRTSPIAPDVARRLDLVVERVAVVWRNMPPAAVFTIRRATAVQP